MSARLSKDGAHVICAMVDCGQQLAWIMRTEQENNGEPYVWLPPGWGWRKGGRVWTLTARARRRLRGDAWNNPSGQSAQAVKVYAYMDTDDGPIGWLPALPCEIVCPACALRQPMEASTLRLRPRRYGPGAKPGSPWHYGMRQLRPGAEMERWQRDPLRFQ